MPEYNPYVDWSAADWLNVFANYLWSEYRAYWELDNVHPGSQLTPENRSRNAQLDELAEAITPCLHSLTVGPEVIAKIEAIVRDMLGTRSLDRETAAALTRIMHSYPIVRDGIRIGLAFQAADVLLAGAEERVPTLISLIADRQLSERAAAFLDRATRLYLWGFEPESIVMCAAVLEAAYEHRFPPEEMFRLQIPLREKDFRPADYEQAALAEGIFTKQEKDAATKVRRLRNDILHNVPTVAGAAVDSLRTSAMLLGRLFPTSP